jgi:hypothetical protein
MAKASSAIREGNDPRTQPHIQSGRAYIEDPLETTNGTNNPLTRRRYTAFIAF